MDGKYAQPATLVLAFHGRHYRGKARAGQPEAFMLVEQLQGIRHKINAAASQIFRWPGRAMSRLAPHLSRPLDAVGLVIFFLWSRRFRPQWYPRDGAMIA